MNLELAPLEPGLEYWLESVDRHGNVESRDLIPTHNLVPIEGLNLALGNLWTGVTAVTLWYIGLLQTPYAPVATVKASTLASFATECTAYAATTRPLFVAGAIAGGAVSNAASLAIFTFTADSIIYGSFVSSASAKGSAAGVLSSVVSFASPKTKEAGSTLRVLVGPAAISA